MEKDIFDLRKRRAGDRSHRQRRYMERTTIGSHIIQRKVVEDPAALIRRYTCRVYARDATSHWDFLEVHLWKATIAHAP